MVKRYGLCTLSLLVHLDLYLMGVVANLLCEQDPNCDCSYLATVIASLLELRNVVRDCVALCVVVSMVAKSAC